MSSFEKLPRYHSYVLTFWEERSHDPDASVVWRFSLKDPHTNQRRGFPGLQEMVAFLQTEFLSNADKLPG